MRFIRKDYEEPSFFTEWKGEETPDWKPTFEEMSIKKELKAFLIEEQIGLCCYCESKLKENYSHIEHFRPQKSFPELSLDYQNMLCSCQCNLKKGMPVHCGNAKGDWFDETKLISPLNENCRAHFHFTGDGHIYPSDESDTAAKETISHLALDIAELVKSRKGVIDSFLDENISDEEFQDYHKRYLETLSADNPPEFISAVLDTFPSNH